MRLRNDHRDIELSINNRLLNNDVYHFYEQWADKKEWEKTPQEMNSIELTNTRFASIVPINKIDSEKR